MCQEVKSTSRLPPGSSQPQLTHYGINIMRLTLNSTDTVFLFQGPGDTFSPTHAPTTLFVNTMKKYHEKICVKTKDLAAILISLSSFVYNLHIARLPSTVTALEAELTCDMLYLSASISAQLSNHARLDKTE